MHLVYELGKFRMAECSCFGLSWFVWEADSKDTKVGWLRLKSTKMVLAASPGSGKPHQLTVHLENKIENDKKGQKWQLLQTQATGGFQIKSMAAGSHQPYFLAITPESNLVAQNSAHTSLNTVWKLKEGIYIKSCSSNVLNDIIISS